MGRRLIPPIIIKEYNDGMSVLSLSRKFNFVESSIYDYLKRNDVEFRGSRNFSDAEEAEIAKIYQAGHSARAIARAYGLSHHISICSALERQGITQRPAPERNRLYSLNPHVFDMIDNEQAAYWWGFIYADGGVNRRTLTVHIKEQDMNHLELLRDFIQSESPIKKQIQRLNGYSKSYTRYAIDFTDRHVASRLRELGIIPNRPNPQKALYHLPAYMAHHWIRGYFDGDGSARKSPSIAFCGSNELLIWLREQFANEAETNPELAVTKHNKANIYYLYISGRIQALKVTEYMYRDATVWMPRKRKVIDSWPVPKERHRNTKGQWA